jgi:hypothetical protein
MTHKTGYHPSTEAAAFDTHAAMLQSGFLFLPGRYKLVLSPSRLGNIKSNT